MTVEEQGELNHTVYLHSLLRRIARQSLARARRQAEAQARQEDRQEGRQAGRQEGEQREQRTLLSVASRIVSPSELERLGKLTLEQLRVEVEARIAALAGQQRQG
jgi:flagellar biosynthesis/type III secretory pathway protein FliH